MALYAHALIEIDDHKFQRGDVVPDDLPGIDDLIAGGAVSDSEYDPAADEVPAPEVIEVDGVKYIKSDDSAGTEEVSNA